MIRPKDTLVQHEYMRLLFSPFKVTNGIQPKLTY